MPPLKLRDRDLTTFMVRVRSQLQFLHLVVIEHCHVPVRLLAQRQVRRLVIWRIIRGVLRLSSNPLVLPRIRRDEAAPPRHWAGSGDVCLEWSSGPLGGREMSVRGQTLRGLKARELGFEVRRRHARSKQLHRRIWSFPTTAVFRSFGRASHLPPFLKSSCG